MRLKPRSLGSVTTAQGLRLKKIASQAFLEKNIFSKLNDQQSLAKDFEMVRSKRAIRQNNNLEDWGWGLKLIKLRLGPAQIFLIL